MDPNIGKDRFPYGRLELRFEKISYDGLLKKHQQEYLAQFPNEEFHRVIDIIRGYADAEYLELIKKKEAKEEPHVRSLVYLDRNNTADIW